MRFRLLCFCCLIFGNVFSQSASIQWGEATKVANDPIWTYHIGEKKGFPLVLFKMSNHPEIFTLCKIDPVTSNVITSKEIFNDDVRKKYNMVLYYEGIHLISNNLFLYLSAFDKDKGTTTLFVQRLTEDGNTIGELQQLEVIEKTKDKERGGFTIDISSDSTMILVAKDPSYEKDKDDESYFKAFDLDFKILNQYHVVLPYTDKKFRAFNYLLAEDRTIYIIGKVDIGRKDELKGESKYYMEVIVVSPENTIQRFNMKLPGKDIHSYFVRITDDDNLVFTGIYADVDGVDLDGIFYSQIDGKSKQVVKQSFQRFSDVFLKDVIGTSYLREDQGIRKSYVLDAFIFNQSECTFILEEAINTWSPPSSITPSKVIEAKRNNIVLVSFNDSGRVTRHINIPKEQGFANRQVIYCSFGLLKHNDNIALLYHDSKSNLERKDKDIKQSVYIGKSVATLVECEKNGVYKKTMLEDNKDLDSHIVPTFTGQIERNLKPLLYSFDFKANTFKIGKVIFN